MAQETKILPKGHAFPGGPQPKFVRDRAIDRETHRLAGMKKELESEQRPTIRKALEAQIENQQHVIRELTEKPLNKN